MVAPRPGPPLSFFSLPLSLSFPPEIQNRSRKASRRKREEKGSEATFDISFSLCAGPQRTKGKDGIMVGWRVGFSVAPRRGEKRWGKREVNCCLVVIKGHFSLVLSSLGRRLALESHPRERGKERKRKDKACGGNSRRCWFSGTNFTLDPNSVRGPFTMIPYSSTVALYFGATLDRAWCFSFFPFPHDMPPPPLPPPPPPSFSRLIAGAFGS